MYLRKIINTDSMSVIEDSGLQFQVSGMELKVMPLSFATDNKEATHFPLEIHIRCTTTIIISEHCSAILSSAALSRRLVKGFWGDPLTAQYVIIGANSRL